MISPRRHIARILRSSPRIASRTRSCAAMISWSFLKSFVPIVGVPLNIMCSNKCAMPVIPGRSLALPTRATQPPEIDGASCRSTSSTLSPLERKCSFTGTFWPNTAIAGNKKRKTSFFMVSR